jgi:undecaprenyl-diphosphatase
MWHGLGDRYPGMKRSLFTRRYDLVMLLAGLAVVVGLWVFFEISEAVRAGRVLDLDERVLLALRSPDNPHVPLGPVWLASAARDVTALGSHALLGLTVLVTAGYFGLRRRFDAMWLIVLVGISGSLLNNFLKHLFGRPRPPSAEHLFLHTFSFPSGHAMLSAIVCLSLGALVAGMEPNRKVRIYVLAVAMFITFLVGASRVYLGAHYPTDVLAGWTAGLIWALLWWIAARALRRRGELRNGE